jgi:hypothetical protein
MNFFTDMIDIIISDHKILSLQRVETITGVLFP